MKTIDLTSLTTKLSAKGVRYNKHTGTDDMGKNRIRITYTGDDGIVFRFNFGYQPDYVEADIRFPHAVKLNNSMYTGIFFKVDGTCIQESVVTKMMQYLKLAHAELRK